MSKIKFLFTLILIIGISLTACSLTDGQNDNESDQPIGMANPASVYCIESGGTLEIRSSADGEFGVCLFEDGSECDEWAYFRDECQPGGEKRADSAGEAVRTTFEVVAWYGRVISSGSIVPAESKLLIGPEGTGEVFVTGENGAIENLIISIRDQEPPGNYANFWGWLDCPGIDDCLLTVTQIRLDGPGESSPDVVDGWEGTLVTTRTEPGSGGNDCLVVSGQFEIQYGIHGADDGINQLIEEYKDSGKIIRVWGLLYAGIPDWNGTQIFVNRIEVVE